MINRRNKQDEALGYLAETYKCYACVASNFKVCLSPLVHLNLFLVLWLVQHTFYIERGLVVLRAKHENSNIETEWLNREVDWKGFKATGSIWIPKQRKDGKDASKSEYTIQEAKNGNT